MKTHRTRNLLATLALTTGTWLLAPGLRAATPTWDGTTDMNWTQPDSTSWTGATYSSGDTALFNGAGQGTVTVQAGGVSPGAMTIGAGANNYTFTGGAFSGSFLLDIQSTGTIRLEGNNSGWTGGLKENANWANSTLQITSASALGSGPIRLGGNYGGLKLQNTSGGLLTIPNLIQFPFTGTRNLTTLGSDFKFTGNMGTATGGGTFSWGVNIGTAGQTVELAGTSLASANGLRLATSPNGGLSGTVILSGDFTNMNGPLGTQYNGYGLTLQIATNTLATSPTATYIFGSQGTLPETLIASGTDRTLGGALNFDGYDGRVIVSGTNKLTLSGNVAQFWNSGGSGAPFRIQVDLGSTAVFGGNWTAYPIQGANAKTIMKDGAGMLVINGDMTAAATPRSALTVNAGTLAGTGTLTSGGVTIAGGAFLAPGNSTGKLTVAGNLTQQALGTTLIELAGTGQGTTYDWLSVAGTANLAGTLSVSAQTSPWFLDYGQTFTVVTAASITNSGLSLGGPNASWFSWNVGANSIVLTSLIPEPGALTLLGAGALLALRRRR